jgi:beta-phosphoglucomutase family hydrolase
MYAYIFDFDGVLVNTMEAHYICNRTVLEEAGVPMDKARYFSQAGMTGHEQIKSFCNAAGRSMTFEQIDSLYKKKKELYLQYMDAATGIGCNIELLRMLKTAGVPVAIASGASRDSLIPTAEMFGISVDAVVAAGDVKRGKPHPDLFLCAAQRLGVAPENCIVIEDSDAGIEAARAAGMKSMRFRDNT